MQQIAHLRGGPCDGQGCDFFGPYFERWFSAGAWMPPEQWKKARYLWMVEDYRYVGVFERWYDWYSEPCDPPDWLTAVIQVTPEMEEAGFRVWKSSGISQEHLEADKLVLAEIYRAMAACDPARGALPLPGGTGPVIQG